jgi:hypothetical protein
MSFSKRWIDMLPPAEYFLDRFVEPGIWIDELDMEAPVPPPFNFNPWGHPNDLRSGDAR